MFGAHLRGPLMPSDHRGSMSKYDADVWHRCLRFGQYTYSFLDPLPIKSLCNKKLEIQTYITTVLKDRGKEIYIAPYIHEQIHIH